MPVQPTYPGVYIEELPSGVRTITGVSTSTAAFVGTAQRGPINQAVRMLSFADFERRFGGLSVDSEMSYAVRQFFTNGGSEAWVVRLAKDPTPAKLDLAIKGVGTVLRLTALEEGLASNRIQVRVDYATGNPASTFNLELFLPGEDASSPGRVERFENLSMNSKDPRYVVSAVTARSLLVKAERPQALVVTGLPAGTSTSATLSDVATLLDSTHNWFSVSVNGLPAVTIQIDLPADVAGGTAAARLATLCAAIQSKATLLGFQCAVDASASRIKLTSTATDETSSIRVLPAPANDASVRLKLGTLNGGTETDAVAAIRPPIVPDPGKLVGASPAPTGPVPVGAFQLGLDGMAMARVAISGGPDLETARGQIESAVRAVKPSHPAYKDFTCTIANTGLVLASGTRGAGSSVAVSKDGTDTLADTLKLVGTGATAIPGQDLTLGGGSEQPLAKADYYANFIGSRDQRKGIFALESVDLFNLLCLPGVTDPAVLADADAYCRERRAFFIIDAPLDAVTPAQMEMVIRGTDLPKSDHAAVYYPWIQIGDPLRGGDLRPTAPCGTLAGLYARTDSARGVWKAPAGTDATLTGVQAVTYLLTDPENGVLNPLGVNCLRIKPAYGAISWGARTLRGANELASEWKYIPVRRLALYIEESLFRGTHWVVFEPNDEPLWAQIRLNVGAFMNTLFRQGAFQGSSPRDAYLVRCDKTTTTQDDVNRGVVNILVGFAPLKPAEFVIIQIQQIAGQIQT